VSDNIHYCRHESENSVIIIKAEENIRKYIKLGDIKLAHKLTRIG